MPKRTDIHKVLIIGSGPIIIGQACEFDYSGTQACKALRKEGYEIVLVNSNPATIMTDPGMADHTYIEPLTVDSIEKIIQKEKPDALLPNLGGQTALNLSIELDEAGILSRNNVKVIGVDLNAIKRGEAARHSHGEIRTLLFPRRSRKDCEGLRLPGRPPSRLHHGRNRRRHRLQRRRTP